jgi:AcrR family transcriptional regulator
MYVQGVGATTLDDVVRASGTSKSQFYRHFPDKQALVRDVIALQAENVLSRQDEQPGSAEVFYLALAATA